jgi:hypothetical protein
VSEAFQVYWTVCNTAANPPPSVIPYELTIASVQDGTETPIRRLSFAPPALVACDCTTEVVLFNSPTSADPSRQLAAGTYRFRLSEPYANATMEQIVVAP